MPRGSTRANSRVPASQRPPAATCRFRSPYVFLLQGYQTGLRVDQKDQVYQLCGLPGVFGRFSEELLARHGPQLGVDSLEQSLLRTMVTGDGRLEDPLDPLATARVRVWSLGLSHAGPLWRASERAVLPASTIVAKADPQHPTPHQARVHTDPKYGSRPPFAHEGDGASRSRTRTSGVGFLRSRLGRKKPGTLPDGVFCAARLSALGGVRLIGTA